ncbi:MAG TPA: TonB-dependent receptor [Caulobacteraceae bacterium]|jgi:outer membrane receptor protein involved in Fe transport|nr:TonB-dependent receptor [Caulobacteraceae bacterium]
MKLIVALCGGASLLAMAPAAFAQQAPGDGPVATASTDVGAVVVTGSRIVRNGYAAPTPVTVAPVAQLEAATPSTIPDALNKLPVFNGSTAANAGSSGSGVTGNFLNLRSFGINRTLVLMDGRRVAPSNFNGQVDANSIPQLLIQRVDVVTGGASAVYGSDAVTGVVNFVVDTHFTGLKGVVQDGISDHGDMPSFRAGLAGGAKVFDNAHIIWSYEHFQEGGLVHEQRTYGENRASYVGAGTAANPYVLVNTPRLSNNAFGGLVTSGPFAGQQFVGSGTLAPFNPGAPTTLANIATGGDGAYYNAEPLYASQRSDQGFARFEFEVGDFATAYMQASGTETHSHAQASNSTDTLTIFSGNPFLPAAAQAQLTATNTPSFTMNRLPRDLNLDSTQSQQTDSGSFTAGLTGKIFDRFKWDAYLTHGESRFRQHLTNNINTANYLAAIDAVKDPATGAAVCRVTLTNPGLYPGCAPLDVFGTYNESAAAKDFIYQDTQFQVLNKLNDYAVSLSGDAFNNWAGPVSVAFNAEYRAQSLEETTNANPLAVPSLTGIQFGKAPTSVYAYATVAPVKAGNNVKEASAETVIPLLKGAAFAKSLEISGAVRYADYSSSGGATTWKVGLDYQPVDELRLRATESQDIRAPTLYDLYAGQSVIVQNLTDPHTGVSRVANIITQGNPNLVPEVAHTVTFGAVYSPSWAPRFRMSVDYYEIKLANAITSIQGNQPATLNECETSGGSSPICALIVRPLPFSDHSAANFPTTVLTENLNIANTYTRGIDVEASYNTDLAAIWARAPGALNFRVLYSYQPVLKTQNFPNAVVTNAAGAAATTGTPGVAANRATIMVGYQLGPFSLDWQTRYSGKLNRSGNPSLVFADPPLPAIMTSDINVAYRFKVSGHDLNAFVNVQNLFNQPPRISPNLTYAGIPGFGNPIVQGDDGIGRYFTFGVRMKY